MTHEQRGHYGIAMFRPQHQSNIGSVIRAAGAFDADYVVTIGESYQGNATAVGHDKHVPIWSVASFEQLKETMPTDTDIVLVDYDESATKLRRYPHPERALYVLGQEGPGFPDDFETEQYDSVYIPSDYCLNVAVAGNMVLENRYNS